ncbi:MAG: hypothetical protein VCC19_02165, partial [Myxococcota bacterium]
RVLFRPRVLFRSRHGEDIESVEQLVTGSQPILERLPSPEPSSLPAPLREGSRWTLAERTGVIVSSYYGRRYQVHVDEGSRKFRRQNADEKAEKGHQKQGSAANDVD